MRFIEGDKGLRSDLIRCRTALLARWCTEEAAKANGWV